jgi:glycolate oxidase
LETSKIAKDLSKLVGKDKVFTDEALLEIYSKDPLGNVGKAIAVVFPESALDVSKVISYAYKNNIKVYAQGSSTSLAGSSLPTEPGIVISFERMKRILEFNLVNSYVVVEPGVRIDDLNLELAKYGYMFPVDPASSSVATVGGAINSGAGGMRGAKYGTMRDWVLGLELVLPDENGSIVFAGCKTLKCRQGYDLVRLIVGSEGTLALVTKAYLKVMPLPEKVIVALAFFPELEDLMEAVVDIKSQGVQPYMLEFLERRTAEIAAESINSDIPIKGHMLLVGIDVNNEAVSRFVRWVEKVLKSHNATNVYTAGSWEEAEEKGLFNIRRALFVAQMEMARRTYKNVKNSKVMVLIEDIAVPPSRLVEAVRGLKELEKKYGFPTMLGGHVGDGNLHPSIGFNAADPSETEKAKEWFKDLIRLTISLDGTVSSEHGIGIMKKEALRMELEAHNSVKLLEIMKGIKKVFDPKGILNPGKVV